MKTSDLVNVFPSAKDSMDSANRASRELFEICESLMVAPGFAVPFPVDSLLYLLGGRLRRGADAWILIVPSIVSSHLSVHSTLWNRLWFIMYSIASQTPQMRNRAVIAAPVKISTSS